MSATIYSFDKIDYEKFIFPDFLFFDTSFLLNSLVPIPEAVPDFPTKIHIQCSNFLDKLKEKARKQEMCLFISDSVFQEFLYFILRNKVKFKYKDQYEDHFKEYRSKSKNLIATLLKDHPELVSECYPILKEYFERLSEIPIAIIDPELLISKDGISISERMSLLIESFQILPADALHISIALKAGINNFVAMDYDFHRVEGINVYTSFNEKARSCSVCG